MSILNNLPFGILFVDETLKILDLNQRVTQLLGISNTNEIIKFLDEAIRRYEDKIYKVGSFVSFVHQKKFVNATKLRVKIQF